MHLIQSLASKELVRNLPKLKFDQHFCDACKIGKQAHASHKAKNIVSTTRYLELLHMDLFSPSAIRSYEGNRYTLVIVDDYSRYCEPVEGDENFGFFHGIINKKCNIRSIRGVMVDDTWIDNPKNMEFPNQIQLDQRNELESDVSNDEIKKAVYGDGAGKIKAMVPMALHLDFSVIFGTLLKKKFKTLKKQSLIFKVDFEKAYDSVRWDFLENVLRKFGFGDKWCKWIQCCLHSSRGSIIINGSPTDEFQFGKGLKQGDPLSPFLFILIMETLHLSFQRVVDAGMFHGLKLGGTLNLSHMFYADNAVFVGEWSENNIATLVHVLDCFHKVSGLKINMNKSKIMGTHVDHDKVSRATNKLGCQILKAPFLYLGSYVGGNMNRLKSWDDIINRC
ncbi:RNA-directed DNA polymerase, eukaryota [Tanacetum coccineum]